MGHVFDLMIYSIWNGYITFFALYAFANGNNHGVLLLLVSVNEPDGLRKTEISNMATKQ